ncbi:hypothetical protein [Listeria booriae]|uniref:hypothetical protein n=1 Tax=Listeria booriae TaxID=1552123 RepID=UPI001C8B3B70|nr:hypothetical protein [Listeria booriae]
MIGVVWWGLTISEWGSLLAMVITLFSALAWIFKKIVAKPFMDRFDNLSNSMDNLAGQLEESRRDRLKLHRRVDETNSKVDIVETRLDYIEDDIKDLKKKGNDWK